VPVYVRGSHKWGKEYKTNPFLVQTPFPDAVGEDLPDISQNMDDYDILRFETKPGDVLIHHFRTVHGAAGNHSHRPRRAASLRYIGDDMRYYNRPGAPPQPYHDHNLKEGDPLDSRAFPVVWPKPYPGFALAPLYDAEQREAVTAQKGAAAA
jgi:ectoine hydroxylase-related dioxygenase (phytanoyl-CoA dioxygenase family)